MFLDPSQSRQLIDNVHVSQNQNVDTNTSSIYTISSLKETAGSRSAYMPSSTITSNLQERDKPASASYDGSRKMNNCVIRPFILGNSGKSKSIRAVIDDQARGGRGRGGRNLNPSLVSSIESLHPRLSIRLVASRLHLCLIVPAFLPHISPSRRRQLAFQTSYSTSLRRNCHPIFPFVWPSSWVVVVGIIRIE